MEILTAASKTDPSRRAPARSLSLEESRDAGFSYAVLVIEDEPDVAELMRLHLEDLPARVVIVGEGPRGLAEGLSAKYDLVVLDVRLPGLNGLEICRRLRAEGVSTPVLIASARASDAERVAGLEIGADDYLGKPFNVVELVARAKALLRRSAAGGALSAGRNILGTVDLRIDPLRRTVHVGKRDVRLTAREFDLLCVLARSPGRVFTKAELLAAAWQRPYEGYEHSVTCSINRLREKIEREPHSPRCVVTVRGVGYKLADP